MDEKTWLFHLKRGDYSNWLRSSLKDPELADEIAAIEKDESLEDGQSRQRVKEMIHQKYTAPA